MSTIVLPADPMEVLVLVLSCSQPPYDALLAAQDRTWAAVPVRGAATYYYFGDSGLEHLGRAFAEALRAVWDLPWRYLFRTNSSSYVDKARLLERSRALPKARCYCGVDGGGFASGSGFFLSRDAAEILLQRLDPAPPTPDGADDVLFGRLLAEADITVTPGAHRYDYWLGSVHGEPIGKPPGDHEQILRDAYHVRCKALGLDRSWDVAAMERVHQIKGAVRG